MADKNKKNLSCDNCGKRYSQDELNRAFPDIPDLSMRVEPGRIVPAGECNDCGALVYPDMGVYVGDDSRDNPCFKSLGVIEAVEDPVDGCPVLVVYPGDDDILVQY